MKYRVNIIEKKSSVIVESYNCKSKRQADLRFGLLYTRPEFDHDKYDVQLVGLRDEDSLT